MHVCWSSVKELAYKVSRTNNFSINYFNFSFYVTRNKCGVSGTHSTVCRWMQFIDFPTSPEIIPFRNYWIHYALNQWRHSLSYSSYSKRNLWQKTRGETYVKTNDIILYGNEILDLKIFI